MDAKRDSQPTPAVSDKKISGNSFFVKRSHIILFIIVFAAFGAYLIFNSSAATETLSETWNTAAEWDAGTLNDTVVVTSGSTSSVALAQSTNGTTGTTGTGGGSGSSGSSPTPSTTDLALNRPCKASSTNYSNVGVYLPCSAAFDGNSATRWGSQYSDPQWISVDLGQSYKINEVKLDWEVAYGKHYKVQVSNNDKTWTTIYSTTSGSTGINDLTGLSGTGRYVRMYGTKRGTAWGYSLWEMDVYGTPSSATPVVASPPTTPTTPTTPSKAATYDTSGTITVSYDANSSVTWTSLTPNTTLPSGTGISYQARTSSNDSSWSSWSTVPSGFSLSALASSQYIQIMATLSTSNTSSTPLLNSLTLDYDSTIAGPSASLTATATNITAGQSVTLSWNSQNATSCTASNGWSGTEGTSGSEAVTPTQTTTYDLSCTGAGGTVSATPVTVTVTAPPPVTTTSNGCSYSGVVAPCTTGSNEGTGGSGWGKPIFDDEFTSDSALNTSDWSTGWFGSGITGDVGALSYSPPLGDCNDPKQVTFNGGLNITLIQQSENCTTKGTNANWQYTTGMLTTMASGGGSDLFNFTYGFAEARIYLPAQNGSDAVADWPSWWIQSPNDGGSGSEYGEIDMLEGLSGAPCWHVHGVNGDTDGGYCGSGDWTAGWHTFAVNWEPGSATFYYDGLAVGGTVNTSDLTSPNIGPGRLILSLGLNSDETAPATMKVQYARVWASSNTSYNK